MKTILYFILNIFIIGLFLYSKLLPYKDRLTGSYKNIFEFSHKLFSPVFNLLKKVFKPVQVGTNLYVDMTQVVLLLILLLGISFLK